VKSAVALLVCLGIAQGSLAAPDQNDRRHSLKLIALAPHIVEQLYAIGAGEQIIGTTGYADYPEAARAIPVVGSYAGLQIEKIVQMQPDLVIAWKTGNPAADLARLQKYQMPIVYSDIRSLDDVAAELRQFGELTGRQTEAEQQAQAYEKELSRLRQRYSGKTPVRVFYELWSRPLTTVAGNAWPQQQLELCGAENPFADSLDDYPHVGLEQVLVSQPQAIVQPSKHSQDSPDAINWQKWPLIPAVKNQAIFHPDADKVHRMTARTLPEIDALCQQIDGVRNMGKQER
jgi:vitamin B12 transport system substrate-binding protein